MHRSILLFTLLGLLAGAVESRADSPLTSTDLATAYAELPAVAEARRSGRVAGDVLRLLVSGAPTDQKVAVVNALGWENPGNAEAFVAGLAAARRVALAELKLAELTAADRLVLGYLLAMEGHLDPQPLRPGGLDLWGATPEELLDQAAVTLREDFAAHYVRALLEADRAMSRSFCSAYLATERVLERFPPKRRNLRAAAVARAQGYMELYKEDCAEAPLTATAAAKASLSREHNQIYALARLREWIVAGTQAGVVVWHPEADRPVAAKDEKICGELVVWRDSAWAGCYGVLLRWNGVGFESYLADATRSESAYAPFLGPEGSLWVRYGTAAWRYDPQHDAFLPAPLDLGGDAWAVLYRRNGEPWRIEFLRAIVGPGRRFALRSPEYPGSDPRELVEDPEGRLWVVDFRDGYFRLEGSDRFVRVEEAPADASSVGFDAARGRTWYLQYTQSLVLEQDGRVRDSLSLRELEYLRDLLVDPDGSLWVAGWNQLLRLRWDAGRWTRRSWKVD